MQVIMILYVSSIACVDRSEEADQLVVINDDAEVVGRLGERIHKLEYNHTEGVVSTKIPAQLQTVEVIALHLRHMFLELV